EYRCEDGEITNIEDQKKLDKENSAYLELLRMRQKDMDELKKQYEKQEKQFVIKELMLTEAYNAKRMEVETLKGELEEWEAQHTAVATARRNAAYRAARLED
ncbi:MAG: hypothetical protein II008_06200, partial [Oscillospiraceae bacterium]|nr:hypothetical protein [Oscillospiraceae bacterium]